MAGGEEEQFHQLLSRRLLRSDREINSTATRGKTIHTPTAIITLPDADLSAISIVSRVFTGFKRIAQSSSGLPVEGLILWYFQIEFDPEAEIAAAKKQIEELQNISEVLRSRQAKLKKDISLIDEILKEGKLSEAHLRLLVDKILVHEHDGKIDLDIRIKAPFRGHTDYYEDGEIVERFGELDFDWDRLAHILYGDYVEK